MNDYMYEYEGKGWRREGAEDGGGEERGTEE